MLSMLEIWISCNGSSISPRRLSWPCDWVHIEMGYWCNRVFNKFWLFFVISFQVINGMHHCPFEADKRHQTPDNLFYVNSQDALRRHMAVHHQLLLRPIPQPDGTKLDMLVVPTVTELTQELANSYNGPGLPEAREAAQDRIYWRMFTKHSATNS